MHSLPPPAFAKTILFQNNSGEEEGRKLLSNKCEARKEGRKEGRKERKEERKKEGRHHLRDAEQSQTFSMGMKNKIQHFCFNH